MKFLIPAGLIEKWADVATFWLAVLALLLACGIVFGATIPSYTVSLYKGTSKVTDVSADTEVGAFLVCFEHAKTIQATTTSKVTCKTPVMSLATVPDPPPVTSVTLSWTTPTQNIDGSPLTDLAGYRILYGQSCGALTQSISVGNVMSYVVQNLTPGSWCFAVKAVTPRGESDPSNTLGKTL